jgi:hypothetical protein
MLLKHHVQIFGKLPEAVIYVRMLSGNGNAAAQDCDDIIDRDWDCASWPGHCREHLQKLALSIFLMVGSG